MTYEKQLEKRIEELEEKSELTCKIKREAFKFRRIVKIAIIHKAKYEKQVSLLTHDFNKIKRDGWQSEMALDRLQKRIQNTKGRIEELEYILFDLKDIEADMDNYTEEELLSPDFFRF